MLDQSFSADNFRRILDLANRKGVHVEEKFSMTAIRDINKQIKECNNDLRIKRKAGDSEAINALYEKKKKLRDQKDLMLQSELEKVSQKIADKSFRIELKEVKIPNKKTLYTTPNTPEHFFALKQIQHNLARLFGVKQANRNSIIEQVISLVGDNFPKHIIRTDIENFYESIPHKPLLQKIHRDNLLTPLSRKILTDVLKSYNDKSGTDKGIPRGIGVSAYLAELYMRDIDNDILDLPGVTYYARYVDDIIIIFTPSPGEEGRNYLQEVRECVEKRQVHLNDQKTDSIDLSTTTVTRSFSYLGYHIIFSKREVSTKLTDSKINKYKTRIESAFNHYVNYSKIDEKSARKILVKRIRFLTGNTRLTNNKKNILVGIYYSNAQLTNTEQLNDIYDFLVDQISQKITSPHLKARLKKYKFLTGFGDKRFSPFTTEELSEIMEVWQKPY